MNRNWDAAFAACKSYEEAEVSAALQAAIDAAGGLAWVTPGMRVALKLNLVSAMKPEQAATVHPAGRLRAGKAADGARCARHSWRQPRRAVYCGASAARLRCDRPACRPEASARSLTRIFPSALSRIRKQRRPEALR